VENNHQPIIFGEVLFDCFPNGRKVLGGAPFNVAWHLQAFGDNPCLISRVGRDEMGAEILQAMRDWGMDITYIQFDSQHSTGRVEITMIDNEPHYSITPDCAYDYISSDTIDLPVNNTILYHGTLALRNHTTRQAYEVLASSPGISIFLDVNLRAPWWHLVEIQDYLKSARWVKLNDIELEKLSQVSGSVEHQMQALQDEYTIELLILTRGASGTIVRSMQGQIYTSPLPVVSQFVDTVGAGDAFTAVFLHGLRMAMPIADIVSAAQDFASKVVGLRGATTLDRNFYRAYRA